MVYARTNLTTDLFENALCHQIGDSPLDELFAYTNKLIN